VVRTLLSLGCHFGFASWAEIALVAPTGVAPPNLTKARCWGRREGAGWRWWG
jgi:hypothetical protein